MSKLPQPSIEKLAAAANKYLVPALMKQVKPEPAVSDKSKPA